MPWSDAEKAEIKKNCDGGLFVIEATLVVAMEKIGRLEAWIKLLEDAAPNHEKSNYVANLEKNKDGGLCNIRPYVNWVPGNGWVTLDSQFTVRQLREIADYIDRHGAKNAGTT